MQHHSLSNKLPLARHGHVQSIIQEHNIILAILDFLAPNHEHDDILSSQTKTAYLQGLHPSNNNSQSLPLAQLRGSRAIRRSEQFTPMEPNADPRLNRHHQPCMPHRTQADLYSANHVLQFLDELWVIFAFLLETRFRRLREPIHIHIPKQDVVSLIASHLSAIHPVCYGHLDNLSTHAKV